MEYAIKELGEIITGNTPSKKENNFWNSEDICFVKPDVIPESGVPVISKSNEYISENARKKARIVAKDSIFVTCIGSIGKIGIAGDGDYAFNQQINVIVPNEKVIPKYLAYNILYNKPRLIAMANAPVVPIINKSQFGDFVVNIETDRTKQREIVEILDKITAIIDKQRNELETFDNLIKARFVEMFGVPTNPMWEISPFEDEVYFQEGPGVRNWQFRNSGIKLINIKNVVDDKLCLDNTDKYLEIEEVNQKYKHFLLNDGDYVMASSGVTWGKIAEVCEEHLPLCLNTSMIRLVPKERIVKKYLFHFVKSEGFRSQIKRLVTGSAQPNFGPSHLKKIVIPVPPEELQDEFSAFVSQVDKSEFESFISNVRAKSSYKTNVAVSADDDIMTLVTCDNRDNSKRVVVLAKLLSE